MSFATLKEYFDEISQKDRIHSEGRVFYCYCTETSHKIVLTFMGSHTDVFKKDDICIEYPVIGKVPLPRKLEPYEYDCSPSPYIRYRYTSYEDSESAERIKSKENKFSYLDAIKNICTAVAHNKPAVIGVEYCDHYKMEKVLNPPSDLFKGTLALLRRSIPLFFTSAYRFMYGLMGKVTFHYDTLLNIEDFNELNKYDPELTIEYEDNMVAGWLNQEITGKEAKFRLTFLDRLRLACSKPIYGIYTKTWYDGEVIKEVDIHHC